jgi:5-methylcytosine-specific restriction endonuclease McrA
MEPTTTATKRCPKCPEDINVKPVSAFYKDVSRADGLTPYCKQCIKKREAKPERVAKRTAYKAAYHIDHATTINARSVQWQKDNPERANAKNKRSKTKHKDKVLAKEAEYRNANREDCNKRARKSRLKKKDLYAAKLKAWWKNNPNKRTEYAHKRRAIENSIPFIEEVDIEVLFKRDKGICGLCHKPVRNLKQASRDHIIPVTVQGSEHSYRNMVLAHKSCNSKKGNRTATQQMRLF